MLSLLVQVAQTRRAATILAVVAVLFQGISGNQVTLKLARSRDK